MNKFYITTPIYYVNDTPHIGHTYTTVIADVLSRYYRNLGYKTFFLTGSDEHGIKIFQTAKKHSLEPKEFCDNIVKEFKSAWNLLEIKYDKFIRTTDVDHEETVKYVLQKLYSNGDIYKANYKGLYCIQCERYVSEDELVDGNCPDHNIPPIVYNEENYFFRLSKYKERIIRSIETDEIKILPLTRKNEILGKVTAKIEDISISRKNLPWGIKIPFDSEHTVYVWIDALINYLSGIDYFNITSLDSQTAQLWPCDLHLIGKDILWFHTVIWPAILFSINVPLPQKVFAHGFFTVEGKKMSKSVGNVIRPQQLVEIFGVDATRLLLISMFPCGTSGDFSINEMKKKYNADLPDNFGNLVTRTIVMVNKYFGENFKPVSISEVCAKEIYKTLQKYVESVANIEPHKMVEAVLSLSSFANRYIQETSPWVVAKNKNTEKLTSILSDLLYCIKAITLLFLPIMPQVVAKVYSMFNEDTNSISQDFASLIIDKKIYLRSQKFVSYGILFKKL